MTKTFLKIIGGLFGFFLTAIIVLYLSVLVSMSSTIDIFIRLLPGDIDRGVNLLVYGIDGTDEVKRSDAIIVVHIDPNNNYVGALSLPRDSMVHIPGRGLSKLNHAYAFGGETLLKKTVEDLLDISVPYVVGLDLEGVQAIVDSVGGLPVYVEKNYKYTDKAGQLFIDLKKGQQVLTGEKALQYMRFRKDKEGDIGRIGRQQKLLDQLAKKVFSASSLFNIPTLYSIFTDYVSMNIPKSDFIKLGLHIKSAFLEKRFSYATLRGDILVINRVSYWALDKKALDADKRHILMGRRFGFQPEGIALHKSSVKVLNSTSLSLDLDKLSSDAPSLNFYAGPVSHNEAPEETALVIWSNKNSALKKWAETQKIDPKRVIVYDSPDKKSAATLIVGKDWTYGSY